MRQARAFAIDGPQAFPRPKLARPIDITDDQEQEFRLAIESYKARSGRSFPTWSEVLEVLHSIGYAKRIWRPVGVWSPILAGGLGEPDGPSGVLGWFSRAETPAGC